MKPAATAVWIFFAILSAPLLWASDADRLLLVVNENSPDSVSAGEYYSAVRGIPPEQICRIETATSPGIERREFERTVFQPLAECLASRRMQDRILFIVTTPGIPLWVSGESGPAGDLASVDSELAWLYRWMVGERPSLLGKLPSSFFHRSPTEPFQPFTREQHGLFLVSRLGLDESQARALTDRGRHPGVPGRVRLDRSAALGRLHQEWFNTAVSRLREQDVVGEIVVGGESGAPELPLSGFLLKPPPEPGVLRSRVRWSPGAVAVLYGDSWSSLHCQTLARETESEQPCPPDAVGALLEEGVSLIFQVGDPGQDGYPRPQILYPALFSGRNLAEAAYSSSRYVSWRMVVVGDPLMRTSDSSSQRAPWVDRIDGATELPEIFSQRREDFLIRKSGTDRETVMLFMRAEAEARMERIPDAVRFLEEALRRSPNLTDAIWLKAELQERTSRFDDAYQTYAQLLESTPGAALALHRKMAVLALRQLEDPARAQPHAQWLYARTGPADREAAGLMVETALRLGQWDRVEAAALSLVRGSPDPPAFALRALGAAAEARGDLASARQFLERALEQAEEGPEEARIRDDLTRLEQLQLSENAEPPAEGAVTVGGQEAEAETSIPRARVLVRTAPEYPREAIEKGRHGRVILSLMIDERGQLIEVRPVSGERSLTRAAERAVRNWKFAPKVIDGRPEVDSITVVINFELTRE